MELFKLFGTIAINNADANKAIGETTDKATEAGKTFENLGSKVSTIGQGITNVGKKITTGMVAVGTTVIGAGTAIFNFAQNTASACDNVDKMSQKIGISREAYQELDFICSQSGTSVDTLQMGIKTLTAAMDGAASGTASNVEQFEKLGISVVDAEGNLRSQQDVMWETMEALQGMDNQTEKARLATELFGRSGTELMPLLNGASGSIEEMKEKAHELGLVLDDETIDSGVEFTDTIDQLKRSFTKAGQVIGSVLMPYVREFAQYLIDHMPQIREQAQLLADKVKELAEKIKGLVGWYKSLDDSQQKTIKTLSLLAVAIGPILILIGKLTTGIGGIITIAGKLAPVFQGAATAISTALGGITVPIAGLVAVVTALVGAFIYLWNTNAEFKDTIISIWNEIKSRIGEFVDQIKERMGGIKEAFQNIVDFITPIWQGFCDILAPLFEGAFQAISDFLSMTLDIIIGLIDVFIGVFTGDWDTFLNGVKEVFEAIWNGIKDYLINILYNIATAMSTAWNKIKSVVVTVWNAIKSAISNALNSIFSTVSNILGSIKGTFSSIFDAVKSKVSSVFDGIKSTISSALNGVKSTVTSILDGIKDKFTTIFDTVKTTVTNAVDTIKNIFDFEWKLPDIELPHFSVHGGKAPYGLGGYGELPSLSIDWYAKGGILDNVMPFGFDGNSIKVGGEAGKEAVIPLENDTKGIELIASKLYENMNGNDDSEQNAKLDKMIDLLQQMILILPTIMDGTSLSINNREFGRLVRSVV